LILAEFEHQLDEVRIVPSGGGVFEVMLDDDLVFSKKAAGRHAEPEEVLSALRDRLR
jgi:selenoprotein W-related protein